jgi:hypothetical protein
LFTYEIKDTHTGNMLGGSDYELILRYKPDISDSYSMADIFRAYFYGNGVEKIADSLNGKEAGEHQWSSVDPSQVTLNIPEDSGALLGYRVKTAKQEEQQLLEKMRKLPHVKDAYAPGNVWPLKRLESGAIDYDWSKYDALQKMLVSGIVFAPSIAMGPSWIEILFEEREVTLRGCIIEAHGPYVDPLLEEWEAQRAAKQEVSKEIAEGEAGEDSDIPSPVESLSGQAKEANEEGDAQLEAQNNLPAMSSQDY